LRFGVDAQDFEAVLSLIQTKAVILGVFLGGGGFAHEVSSEASEGGHAC
jgi:hypothetical protein